VGFSDGSDIPDHVHFVNNSHFVADVCTSATVLLHVEDKLVSKCCTFVYHNITFSALCDNPPYSCIFWSSRRAGITPLLPYVGLLTLITLQNELLEDLKIQENHSSAGALLRTPLGELTALPKTPTCLLPKNPIPAIVLWVLIGKNSRILPSSFSTTSTDYIAARSFRWTRAVAVFI